MKGDSIITSTVDRVMLLAISTSLSSCLLKDYPGTTLGYAWSVLGMVAPSFDFSKAKDSLTIPPHSLTSSTNITIHVDGYTIGTLNFKSTAEFAVNLVSSPPIAVIAGGNKSFASDGVITLSADGSTDPDLVDQVKALSAFMISWDCITPAKDSICTDTYDQPIIVTATISNLTIQAITLKLGIDYYFRVNVSKKGQNLAASAVAFVRAHLSNIDPQISNPSNARLDKLNADSQVSFLG